MGANPSSLAVRPAEAGDAAAIRAVHLAAFPTPIEADLVERLEADGDVAVSLVAERLRAVIGHVVLSRMRVEGDGRRFRALGLAPVAVEPRMQGSGVGSALIEGAIAIARATGEDLVFVLGEPELYRRFGFAPETAAPFASPYAGPFLMALALRPGLALPGRGRADYAPAFAAAAP